MGAGPDLIYMPETDFDMDKFIAEVKKVYAEKGNLGHIDEVGAGAHGGGQTGGGGEPSGVAAHDLDDADHAGVIHPCVVVDLHAGGSDILGGGGEAGAVVRFKKRMYTENWRIEQ